MYPKILFTHTEIRLFGNQLQGKGIELDLSDASNIHEKCTISNQKALQEYANICMNKKNTNWAISGFGEYRKKMFIDLDAKQMVEAGRFYHLGIDLWAPKGFSIFSPLDGIVVESGYEEGYGNYGGYIVIEYRFDLEKIYVVFGHLDPNNLVTTGTYLSQNEFIGKLGNMQQNGGYFYHTHVQVLTELGYKSGFVSKGYADEHTFHNIKKYVLDPSYFILG